MSLRKVAAVIPLVMLLWGIGDEAGGMIAAAQDLVAKTTEVADCANVRQETLVGLVEGLEDPAPPPVSIYPYTFVDVALPEDGSIASVSFEDREGCGETVQHTVVAFTDGATTVIPAPAILMRIDGDTAQFRTG